MSTTINQDPPDIFALIRAAVDEHETRIAGLDKTTGVPGVEEVTRQAVTTLRDTLAEAENLAIALHPVAADAFRLGVTAGRLDAALRSAETAAADAHRSAGHEAGQQ